MKALKHLFTLLLLLCSTVASAQSFEVDGIDYNVTSSTDKTVEVSGGSNVLIPESVTYNGVTYSVTSIGANAFDGRSDLTGELVIPNSVTSIGDYAFSGCSGLTSVIIPNSVESIGEYAFHKCSGLIGELVIPNSVTSIGDLAFYNCKGLTSVVIGNSVTSIGHDAFYGCSGLTSVVIGNSVTSIGNEAFYGCSGLTSIEIPNSVTSIGYNAFYGCSGLTGELVIPNSVTSIGGHAFYGCSGLTSVEIPNSVTSIGYSAFAGCSGLTGELVIPNSVTSIGEWAFSYCTGLTSIVIGNGVTSIGYCVFYGCSGLIGELVIPNSVTSIGGHAFYGCSGLTSVEIPNSVTSIGDGAFYYCSGLTSVTIPNSVTSIESDAFRYCSGLTSVEIPSSVASIGERAFVSVNAIFDIAAETPATVTSDAFSADAVLAVPDASVDAYKAAWSNYANQIFAKELAVRSVEIEASGVGSALRSAIGDEFTTSVADLTVKGTINSYDAIVLRTKMPLLRKLDLSEAKIVASDFPYYNSYCTADNVVGNYMFYDTGIAEIVLPDSITGIGRYAFGSCDNLKKINIPNSVTSIGNNAFEYCSSLTSIEIPNSVTSIGEFAFYYCSGLTSVVIGNSVTSIGYEAFRDCSNLKSVVLPPTVKWIYDYAFNYCYSLEEIRIPSSVESIGYGAFNDCYNLKRVYTYTLEPLAINDGLFPSAPTATLYAPTQSRENYYFAAGWNSFLKFEFFDEPYEYFYVNNDYILNDDTGYIEGVGGENPDADINAGGGFIVEGEQGDEETPNQNLGDVNVGSNGNGTCGSIIGDNNLHIDDLHIKITVSGGRWYFFAFPFDIKFKDITMENGSDYVFRYYDGEERAKKGNGGWKDVNEDHLKAARGYIFQCSANDVLILSIKDVKFKKEDKYNELVAHVSENLKDASWNFTGNPYLSYYDLADMDYTAPVTVWDGEKYVAIRPGDDDYHFAPYEAFFVQKPENQESIAFDGEEQMTQNQSENKKSNQAAARRTRGINPERQLINLVLSNGISDDRTRIVFNDRQSLAYETACDATKFETSGVVQLYTIDSDKVHYAINERPADNGRVLLGYTAPTAGFYTIEAQRMDTEVLVKDLETGTLYNLKEGAYGFSTDAGTFNDRFEILLGGTAPGTTGIDEVEDENGNAECEIYDLQGRKMKDAGKGIYIINGEKVMK